MAMVLTTYMPVTDIFLPSHIIEKQILNYFWANFMTNFESDLPCTTCYVLATDVRVL